MKFLVVGLGNPGLKYENTRHNIGFKVVEAIAKELEIKFEIGRHADICTGKYKGRSLVLIKPTTYMNLSGKAVQYWMQAEKIPSDRILIITDDLALPFGKLRMKGKGSDGGHNGLKDIQTTLNSTEYARLRFGIGADFSKGKQVDYVLGEWSPEELDTLDERINTATEFIKGFVTIGLNQTMSTWNNK